MTTCYRTVALPLALSNQLKYCNALHCASTTLSKNKTLTLSKRESLDIGTEGCFTSPLLCGTALNISEGKEKCVVQKPWNNISDVNNPLVRRICILGCASNPDVQKA